MHTLEHTDADDWTSLAMACATSSPSRTRDTAS